jgi:hypothetical protein
MVLCFFFELVAPAVFFAAGVFFAGARLTGAAFFSAGVLTEEVDG